jgi:D-alanyl-D-alanine carboxypeptidase
MKLPLLLLAPGLLLMTAPTGASPLLLVDASSGNILAAQEATRSWHPASLPKLMTAHLALLAIQSGQLTLETSIVLSARATAQAPTRLGVPPGTSLPAGRSHRNVACWYAADRSRTSAFDPEAVIVEI